jgi:hypothetical protein
MSVTVLTVIVGRRRMLPGLAMLPVGMMIRRLLVMVRGGMMVRGGLTVMIDGGMLLWLCHDLVLLQALGDHGQNAPEAGPIRAIDERAYHPG